MGVEGSLLTVLLGFATGIVMLVLAVRRGHLLSPARGRERSGEGPRGSRAADDPSREDRAGRELSAHA